MSEPINQSKVSTDVAEHLHAPSVGMTRGNFSFKVFANRIFSTLVVLLAIIGVVSIYDKTKPASPDRRDVELSELRSKHADEEAFARKEVRYHLNLSDKYKALAEAKMSQRKESKTELDKLIFAVGKLGRYPSDGPRIANSILGRIQRNASFYREYLKSNPTDEENLVTSPITTMLLIKAIAQVAANKSNSHSDTLITNALAYQFGDEETSYLVRIDLEKLLKDPLPDMIPTWLKDHSK